MDSREISERELVKHASVILESGRIVSPGPADGDTATLPEQLMALAVYASCLARQYWPEDIPVSGPWRS